MLCLIMNDTETGGFQDFRKDFSPRPSSRGVRERGTRENFDFTEVGGVNPLNPSSGSDPKKEIKSESNQSQLGHRVKLYLNTFVHLR